MQKCENNTTAPDDAMEVQSSKTKSKKFLTFQCGQQMFGVDITEVRQIIELPEFTPLPESPEYIKGIVCMHGEAVPVMDLNLRLNQLETISGERTCVVVFTLEGRSFGVIVDGVENVEDILDDAVLPPPGQKESGIDYLLGVVNRNPVVLLVNAYFFISADDIERLSQITDTDGWTQNKDEHTGGIEK
ncbi:chemotaxis protein CheW [Intestinimonas sp. HCP28S3_D6]|uniref:chemotaxis protein CheW n=1 Tax=Eubacteriales TaxID=186802 RepID=UPI003F88C592